MAVIRSAITLFIALCVFLPTRAQPAQLEFDVVENTGDGYSVGRPLQSGGKSFSFAHLDSSHNCSRFFTIDSGSSEIRTRGNLDREQVVRIERSDRLNCIVQYTNTSTNDERHLVLSIHILDVNDETPSFFNLEAPVHIITVLENIGIPNPIQSLQPLDNDKGINGTVIFNITHGNEQNVFEIDRPVGDMDPSSTTRLLYVTKHLDFEKQRQFNLTITLMDMGVPMHLSFNQTLIVNINDSNDELPTFLTSRYSFEVSEDHPLDVSIGNITANDLDSSGTILYTIYSNPNMSSVTEPIIYEYIRVDVNTGDIFLIQHIDYDTNSDLREFNFFVQARNPGQNAVTIATVNVNIMDVNDEPPYFVCYSECPPSNNTQDNLIFFVEENEANLPLYFALFEVQDDDSEAAFTRVNKSIVVEFEPQILTTFRVILGTLVRVGINQTLDREMTPNLTLSLTAHNTAQPPLSGTSTVFIIVTDDNDNAPQFLHNPFHVRISESAPVGKEILTVVAWDNDAGENSTLSFAITGVDKSQARGWFSINQTSGRISVNSSGLNYNSVAGQVTLTVTAMDHGRSPLSNTTRVEITLSPAVTFAQRSFQEYSGYNFFLGERESVYLEFQTTQSRGLLLYQAGLPTKIFALEVVGGNVRCQVESGGQISETSRDTLSVSNDRWHSVLIERNREDITLSVWVTDQQAPSETSRLQDSTLAECGAHQEGSSGYSLYVGGVDLFTLPSNTTLYPDFVGSIRNVIIGTTQLDLECPSREENTVQGFHRSTSCESASLSCTGAHTTGCVDYAPQPYCSCLGGFSPQTCQQEDSYAPIKFQGNAKAEISLGYSFFYDLATADTTTNLGPQRRRRSNTGEEGFMQMVEVSFRPVEISTGLLLYSRTQSFIHVLEIDQDQENMQVITYNVFDVGYSMAVIHIPLNVHLTARALYTATITSTNSEATLTLQTNGTFEVPPISREWRINPVPLFAQQPQTLVSIGGASDPNPNAPLYENFTGCISRVAINRIELPLSGLLNAPGEGGLSTEGSVEASCNLCTPNPCGASMQCVSDQFGSYDCLCPVGFVLTDTRDGCGPATNPPTSDSMVTTLGQRPTENENEFPFYYIIASAAGGLIVAGCVIFVFIMVARCGYNRYERRKRTYHINNEEVGNGHVPVAKPNFYTTVIHPNSETSNHEHSIGSVSTYHEHDIPDDMVDTEIDNPPPFSRRRSTTSAESGIKTDTERDDKSIGGYPRMEDSGNEKDTDYSPPESESDDVTSSCMETALSPSGVNLAGSTSSVSGVPIHVPPPRVPLTPKERKALTPLRPDSSTILSMSEFDDETDMETDVSYKPVPRPHRALGNRSSDSDSISRASASEPGTPKWYKSSTASDTEREKLRAQGTRPYYPTHSEPPRYFPHKPPPPPSHPPNYKSQPTFVQRKNSTPSYSSQRPHLQSVDSPLSRSLKHAYRSVPHSPLSAQPQNPQLTHTPELLSKSQPNRFQFTSTTIPHCQLNSPQAYPYLFTSTSAPYHPRSFSGGDAPQDPPSQQQFQDLKSVSRINPISYWEMQDRMKSTVDQVDPYHILSEPYVQFEDVSTDPSVTESQLTLEESDRQEHQAFSSQGGGEGTADLLDLSLMRLQNGDIDSMVTDGPEIGPPITHFPSADCSEEYTNTNSLVTLVASSRDSSPKQLSSGLSNGSVVPSSQEPFDV